MLSATKDLRELLQGKLAQDHYKLKYQHNHQQKASRSILNKVISAFRESQVALEGCKGIISAGYAGRIDAIRASQAAMERIAPNIERPANVGIGYAFSAEYVRKQI